MGEANQTRVGIVQRTSFATAAALDLLLLPLRSQTMKPNIRKTQSQTLRTDAQIGDVIRLGADSGGGFVLEFVFPVASEALWYLLRAALRATEDAVRTEASATTTAGAKTITKAAIDFTAGANVQVNDIVRVQNTGPDDGFYPATAVGATTITVARDTNFLGSVGNAVVTRGPRMNTGILRYWFDVEIARLDVGLYQLYRQCVVNGFDLQIAEDIITLRVPILGGLTAENTATYALSTIAPAAAAVMDHLGVPDLRFNNTQSVSKSLGLSVLNNIQLNTQVGLDGIGGATWGSTEVKTRWSGYQSTWNELTDHKANTPRPIWFVMTDSASRGVSFMLPEHKWLDLDTPTRGLNQIDYVDGQGQSVALTVASALRMQRWT